MSLHIFVYYIMLSKHFLVFKMRRPAKFIVQSILLGKTTTLFTHYIGHKKLESFRLNLGIVSSPILINQLNSTYLNVPQ